SRRPVHYRTVMQLGGYGMPASHHLDATFAALADPTRRAILARLALGEASVLELAEPFEMTQPAISKHLKVLERAGLVTRGRDAQRRPRKLEAQPLAEATQWLENSPILGRQIPAPRRTPRRNEIHPSKKRAQAVDRSTYVQRPLSVVLRFPGGAGRFPKAQVTAKKTKETTNG